MVEYKRLVFVMFLLSAFAISSCKHNQKEQISEKQLSPYDDVINEMVHSADIQYYSAFVPELRGKRIRNLLSNLRDCIDDDYSSDSLLFKAYLENFNRLEQHLKNKYGLPIEKSVHKLLKKVENKFYEQPREVQLNLLKLHFSSTCTAVIPIFHHDYLALDSISFLPKVVGDSVQLLPTVYNSKSYWGVTLDEVPYQLLVNHIVLPKAEYEAAKERHISMHEIVGVGEDYLREFDLPPVEQ
ncbi:MAG: hypothetical protein CL843_07530 [Crocinitomicaceae bacterium]|nr:hypothetical protein [Crocinitomicaceae bacterium]